MYIIQRAKIMLMFHPLSYTKLLIEFLHQTGLLVSTGLKNWGNEMPKNGEWEEKEKGRRW
jgi:hypothetical protein